MPTDAFSYVDSLVPAGGKPPRRAELSESCHSPEKDCAEEGGKALALEGEVFEDFGAFSGEVLRERAEKTLRVNF